MDKEINFIDIIRPLWLRRYELILSVLLVTVLTTCSLYLVSEKINYDTKEFYHQDIKFHSDLDQKYIQLLSNPDLIRKSYLENGLDSFNEEIIVDIIKHSSRYEAMKENVTEGTLELLVKTLKVGIDQSKKSLWETYLELDTGFYQFIFKDESLTDVESKIIILDIIKNYNLMVNSNNFLNTDILSEIAFNSNNSNLLYLNNRLQMVNSILGNFSEDFKVNNFDVEELRYKSDLMMTHIYNKDPSPLKTNLEKLHQKINQNKLLKVSLEELYNKFYREDNEENLTNIETQLTADSVSQLINLGRDFSELDNKSKLIDTIYRIDIDIADLENDIFEINSIQKIYLNNYSPMSMENVNIETTEIIKILNDNIRFLNNKKSQQAVITVGNTYIKANKLFEINLTLVTILIILTYSMLHVISIYFRNSKDN